MDLLAWGLEQSLLAAVLCDRPSDSHSCRLATFPRLPDSSRVLGNTHDRGWAGYHLGKFSCLANYSYPPAGGMVSWAEVPHKVCMISEIMGQQCSGPGGEGCPPPSLLATGKRRALLTLPNRSGTVIWHPACKRAPGFLASDRLSPQGCRMGP